MQAERVFRALADETRLRCLVLLQQQGELCVCELTQALQLVQPKISRHLALLRQAELVAVRQQGLWMFYRLHPDLPAWVGTVLQTTASALAQQAPFVNDSARLAEMTPRPGVSRCDSSDQETTAVANHLARFTDQTEE